MISASQKGYRKDAEALVGQVSIRVSIARFISISPEASASIEFADTTGLELPGIRFGGVSGQNARWERAEFGGALQTYLIFSMSGNFHDFSKYGSVGA